jgi:hypothetical protein
VSAESISPAGFAGNTFSFVGAQQHIVECPGDSDSRIDSRRSQTKESISAEEISRATLAEHKYAQTIMQDSAVLVSLLVRVRPIDGVRQFGFSSRTESTLRACLQRSTAFQSRLSAVVVLGRT